MTSLSFVGSIPNLLPSLQFPFPQLPWFLFQQSPSLRYGAMDASKKYRGKLSSVILSYTKDMEEDLKNAVPDHREVIAAPAEKIL